MQSLVGLLRNREVFLNNAMIFLDDKCHMKYYSESLLSPSQPACKQVGSAQLGCGCWEQHQL